MKQYVQTDLEADRQVANALAELIIGGALATEVRRQGSTGEAREEDRRAQIRAQMTCKSPLPLDRKGASELGESAGFEP